MQPETHKPTHALTRMSQEIFRNNVIVGWWSEDDILDSKYRPNGKYSPQTAKLIASKQMLIVTEVAESTEGMRKMKKDDHLPHRDMCEVELADVIIRTLDLAAFLGYDIGGAVEEKLAYNAKRADHQMSNRNAAGGKTI